MNCVFHSLGLFYSAFTYYLGFRVNSGEYKVMGLAPYGRKDAESTRKYTDIILNQLIHLYDDGSVWLNQTYFSYATGLRMVPDAKWEKLFGFPRRKPEEPIEQHHCDLPWTMQQVTEKHVRMTRLHTIRYRT
jgi:carbamoyltransferase